jgi:hypothetical protein
MNLIRRFARHVRSWMMAPILQELEQCRSAQREFNAEIKPAVIALLNLLRQRTEPRNVTTFNDSINLMEQLCAAVSAITVASRRTFLMSLEMPEQYREMQRRLEEARSLEQQLRERQQKVRTALADVEAESAGVRRGYSPLISTLTFGYLGRNLEREISSIHAEMDEMTHLVRTLVTQSMDHHTSVNGVDFVAVEAQMRDTIRMAEEALLSLLVDACAHSDLPARKATGPVLDANQHPNESENTLTESRAE